MNMKNEIKQNFLKCITTAGAVCLLAACQNHDIDNRYSRNGSCMEITASADSLVLDENAPEAVALTLEWTPAADYGYEFITTYRYRMELEGSKADAIQEYEDEGVFKRSYTNRELQEILVNRFGQLTSTGGYMKFTVTASFEGPRLVVPDMAAVSVKVKTYGPKQFLADKVFIGGAAAGTAYIELPPSADNPDVYVYNGNLSAGKIYFPVWYGDEINAVCPAVDTEITSEAMPATVTDRQSASAWIIPEAGSYRVTLNLAARTVTIVPSEDILEADKIYLAGTAVGGGEIEVMPALEKESLYAFRGELQAGSLYLPILFNEEKALSIAPKANGSRDIDDGRTVSFAQVPTATAAGSNYWNIPSAGTYRIVVDTEAKTIAIYSPATDLRSKQVSWNNTVAGINPFTSAVEKLWMYGTFNSYAHDSGAPAGFQDKYTLIQSLANPCVFVYKGDTLPKETAKDESGSPVAGTVKFCVSDINNNVYAYGSTADAKRNDHNGYVTVTSNASQPLAEGQKDNRYAYFIIPDNTNYVVVDIERLTVVFDTK